MLTEIQKTFESLEKKYAKLLQHLSSLTDDAMYFKAGPDKWSIVEVIEHLVMVEENMLAQLTDATSATTFDPQDRSAKNYQIVIKVMEKDIPVDVPDESIVFCICFGFEFWNLRFICDLVLVIWDLTHLILDRMYKYFLQITFGTSHYRGICASFSSSSS